MGQFAWTVKFALRNVHFHDSFWREKTLAATKLLLSLTRFDFAIAVSSRAVRISSRAVVCFPTLSLRRVQPSYGTFFRMVFQGNCERGRTGHMINIYILALRSGYFPVAKENSRKCYPFGRQADVNKTR